MRVRVLGVIAGVAIGVGLAACGGGEDAEPLALGAEAVVQHQIAGTQDPPTTIGITVTAVRKGTQAELEAAGFNLDPEEKTATPYYVDARFENQGQNPIKRQLLVGLEDEDGQLLSRTTVIDFGGEPFEKCPSVGTEGELAPGQSYEDCSLFLVPEGRTPEKVEFLPYDPENETEFVYWNIE